MLARLALPTVLLLAAALRSWRLDQNGFGNEYYSAGVRSMSQSLRNFLYHAFDPAGFVSVDKPPLASWIQVASVKVFGFHGLSVLIPQVLEGVAAVWLVHHLVQRRFGRGAGLLAGFFLALTPVSVAVDRSSNTESCLILVRLLSAGALLRASDGLSRLIAFLEANRRGERYLLATSSATLAAPIIVQTGEPVMARGGFHGLDPVLTPDKLARMAEANELRFVMLNDLSLISRRLGAELAGQPIADWVRANGRLVDSSQWRASRRGAMALYDLRSDRGLVSDKASAGP